MIVKTRRYMHIALKAMKGLFGALGMAAVLSEGHPYLSAAFLAMAATASEMLPSFDADPNTN